MRLKLIAIAERLPERRGEGPARVTMVVYEPTRRRDPDNVIAGARKILLDALQDAEVIDGDGWASIAPPFVDWWVVDKDRPRVEVLIEWGAKNAMPPDLGTG